jgi:hypothetical protein
MEAGDCNLTVSCSGAVGRHAVCFSRLSISTEEQAFLHTAAQSSPLNRLNVARTKSEQDDLPWLLVSGQSRSRIVGFAASAHMCVADQQYAKADRVRGCRFSDPMDPGVRTFSNVSPSELRVFQNLSPPRLIAR